MKIMYEIFLSFIDWLMKLSKITKALTISICFMFKSKTVISLQLSILHLSRLRACGGSL